MRSTYQQLSQKYSRLRELVTDIDQFLQNPNNYSELEPDVRAAILDDPNHQFNEHIAKLPQVILLKSVRDSIRTIANDFASEDYTKLVKMLYHLQNFWVVGKNYLLAEKTIALSPEFNSKMLSLISVVLQGNQIFREELHNINIDPQWIFARSKEEAVDDIVKWKHYREKIITLRKMLPRDNKFIPYVKNLEELFNFIINLKEKGALKSNIIVSVLDFIEDFNNASRTSIRSILREYAIFSEDEIKDILFKVNHFWACFLPVCDEVEINACLKQGYLTERLKPVLVFCDALENEYAQDYTAGTYPYAEVRLGRISHAIDEVQALLTKQTQRQENLAKFMQLIEQYLAGETLPVDTIINLHQYIELLDSNTSVKQEFHQLLDVEVDYITQQLAVFKSSLIEFHQLVNKYKVHDIALEEAQRLVALLDIPEVAEQAQNYYAEFNNEYLEFKNHPEVILAKIERGELEDKDIRHLFVMIHLFETQAVDVQTKSELIYGSLNKYIHTLKKLQNLLDLFEANQLPEPDLYHLLSSIDLLDCDASVKDKYKKQIVDLDHKRKNSGYLRFITDFAMGFFTEVTLPFSEIKTNIQSKLSSLQAMIDVSDLREVKPSQKVEKALNNMMNPFRDHSQEWLRLQAKVKVDQENNQKQVDTLRAIYTHHKDRYAQLEDSLKAYRPPMIPFDYVEEPEPPKPFSWKRLFDQMVKKFISFATDLLSTIYSKGKKAINFIKSLFVAKPVTNDDLVIRRIENPVHARPALLEPSPYKELKYKELSFIEDNLQIVLQKLVNPNYHKILDDALRKHQVIQIEDSMPNFYRQATNTPMPYFYQQAANLVNVFIQFRKVVLSYSKWDMLQLALATSNLNTENKAIFMSLLESSSFAKSSAFYSNVIKPTLTNAYQIAADLQTEVNLEKSLPQFIHRIHLAVQSIANNHELDLKPLLAFLKRAGNYIVQPGQSVNEDLGRIYFSINRLAQFVENGINNQNNFLVEALFSLADLMHHLRQISSCTNQLLLKDQFPYLKELSQAAKMLQEILVLFQSNIKPLQEAGLHPNIISTLNKCVAESNKFVTQLTPLGFHAGRIVLEINEIKSNLFKLGPDIVLQRELENIQKLLTTEADQKFITENLLKDIETRLQEIQTKLAQSPSHSWFNFFSNKLGCLEPRNPEEKSYLRRARP